MGRLTLLVFASALTLFAVVGYTWKTAHDAHIEREALRTAQRAIVDGDLEKLCGDAWPLREERYERCVGGAGR